MSTWDGRSHKEDWAKAQEKMLEDMANAKRRALAEAADILVRGRIRYRVSAAAQVAMQEQVARLATATAHAVADLEAEREDHERTRRLYRTLWTLHKEMMA